MVSIGAYTLPGNRYGDLNQDYVVFKEVPHQKAPEQPPCYVAAVLDGHGLLGERAAQLGGDALVDALTAATASNSLSDMAEAQQNKLMQDAFLAAHEAAITLYDNPPSEYEYGIGSREAMVYLLESSEEGVHQYQPQDKTKYKRPLECGTTCTAAVVQGSHLCVANVGDSGAVLGWHDGTAYQACSLTQVHCGLTEAETHRIRELDPSNESVLLLEDGYLAITSGTWAGYELSVTRALGHKHLCQYGVTWEPHVAGRALEEGRHPACLVMASDGVWDALSEEEAVRYVLEWAAEGCSAQEAARQLVEEAVDLSITSDGRSDNASAVVVLFT